METKQLSQNNKTLASQKLYTSYNCNIWMIVKAIKKSFLKCDHALVDLENQDFEQLAEKWNWWTVWQI